MPDVLSANLNLLEQATGSASGAWGANLNTLVIDIVDGALGGNQSVSMSSSNVTLTMAQRQHLVFTVTGTLTGNLNLLLPLQTTVTTLAVGGFFIIDNQTTGAFSITVKTAASGSTGVEVPQGAHSLVYSDTTNVWFADDTQNQTQTFNGNPNGSVAGKAGSASTRASKIIDRSTNTEYLCTTSGTASSAVWFPNLPFTFPCQGYITSNSSTTNPIQTSDSAGATTIYYTALTGNLFFVYNGVSFVPLSITGGQMALALSASSQAANGIYDIIGFSNSGTPTVGFSPAWTTATPGAGARGSGAGTPQMTRINGVPVNAVQQTVNNGSTTYTVAANRGTILGSIAIDSAAGQVTCNVSYGTARKWGISNNWNQQEVRIIGGDSTASWTYGTTAWRQSNGSANNYVDVLSSLPNEPAEITFEQYQTIDANASATILDIEIGIGVNSTASPSGTIGRTGGRGGAAAWGTAGTPLADYILAPTIGINRLYMLEKGNASAATCTFFGTQNNMQMIGRFLA